MDKQEIKYPYLCLDNEQDRKEQLQDRMLSPDAYALEGPVLDPNRHYVRKHLKSAVRHLKDHGVAADTIAETLIDELFGLLSTSPYRIPLDPDAIWDDLAWLKLLRERTETAYGRYQRAFDKACRQADLVPETESTS